MSYLLFLFVTWLQAACGSGPAHHWGYRSDHSSHPGVGDAESLQRRVATGVEKDVERAQEACQGVHCQSEQSHSRNATGQSEWHSMKGADKEEHKEKRDLNAER